MDIGTTASLPRIRSPSRTRPRRGWRPQIGLHICLALRVKAWKGIRSSDSGPTRAPQPPLVGDAWGDAARGAGRAVFGDHHAAFVGADRVARAGLTGRAGGVISTVP